MITHKSLCEPNSLFHSGHIALYIPISINLTTSPYSGHRTIYPKLCERRRATLPAVKAHIQVDVGPWLEPDSFPSLCDVGCARHGSATADKLTLPFLRLSGATQPYIYKNTTNTKRGKHIRGCLKYLKDLIVWWSRRQNMQWVAVICRAISVSSVAESVVRVACKTNMKRKAAHSVCKPGHVYIQPSI